MRIQLYNNAIISGEEGVKTLLPANEHRLLVDGDMLLYRAAWATNDKPQYEAIASFILIMNGIINRLDSDDYICYLSSKTNIRHEVYPLYKANRADTAKPQHLSFLRNWVIEHYKTEIKEGLEADDLIADNVKGDKTIVVSQDKDLKQLVGWNYDFVKNVLMWVNEEEAKFLFNIQMLTGDRTDNIPGLSEKAPKRGIGPAGAKKILNNEELLDNHDFAVFSAYAGKYDVDSTYIMWVNWYMLKVGSFGRTEVEKYIKEYEESW